jgi:cytidine deaminase
MSSKELSSERVESLNLRRKAGAIREAVFSRFGHSGVEEFAPKEKHNTPLTEENVDNINTAIDRSLVQIAREAKSDAFAPHSGFSVGAALLVSTELENKVYTGANVEISAIQPIHAEQLAIAKAVTEGAEEFYAMAISAGENPEGDVAPCGLCQHTMSQFTEELRILEDAGDEEPTEYWLSELIGDGYSASVRHFDEVKDKK